MQIETIFFKKYVLKNIRFVLIFRTNCFFRNKKYVLKISSENQWFQNLAEHEGFLLKSCINPGSTSDRDSPKRVGCNLPLQGRLFDRTVCERDKPRIRVFQKTVCYIVECKWTPQPG